MLLLIAKAALEKDLEKKRVERKTLSTQIQSAGAERQKIGDEINSLRTQRDKHVRYTVYFRVVEIIIFTRFNQTFKAL